jgi:hypothetical protein
MIALWLKLTFSLFAGIVIVIYWRRYGPGNLLWFCDFALLLLIPAVWLESALLLSLAALLVLLPELVWIVLFVSRLLTGWRCGGVLDYMFEPQRPRLLKALSLFHIPMPLLMLWLLTQIGYDPRALTLAIVTAWIILLLSRFLTPPERNINWVHGPGGEGYRQQFMPPGLYLVVLMLSSSLLIHWPSHLALQYFFG